jgi:hypothetical protein
LLVLVLFAVIFGAVAVYGRSGSGIALALLGTALAGITLTKINIGCLLFAALGAVLAMFIKPGHWRFLRGGVHALCVAVPLVLMGRQFSNPVVILQCGVYTFGIWSVLSAVRRNAKPELDWTAIGWIAGGFVGTASVTVAAAVLHGTPLLSVFDGVIFMPLKFSAAIPFTASSGSHVYIAAAAVIGSAVLNVYARRRFQGALPLPLQAAVALVFILILVGTPRGGAALGPAMAWMLVPGANGALWKFTRRAPVYSFIIIATFALLMAYPVWGTQASVAASIMLLAAFAALLHGVDDLRQFIAETRWPGAARQGFAVALVLLVVFGVGMANVFVALKGDAVNNPVDLPHSSMINLPPDRRQTFTEIVARVSSRCATLVTLPGMNSFHIWTGLPHPNGFIVSAAMVMFDEPSQQRLRSAFLAAPQPCVIFNPGLEAWSRRYHRPWPHQPFIDMVHDELVTVYSRDGFEIRIPPAQLPQWR